MKKFFPTFAAFLGVLATLVALLSNGLERPLWFIVAVLWMILSNMEGR